MGDRPVSQPEAESLSIKSEPAVVWGPEEKSWSQSGNCRQVGNTIVCTDIYGGAKPNEAFRAIFALQRDLGLTQQSNTAFRVSDTQPQPYYPPGTLSVPGAGLKAEADIYSFHQGAKPGQIAQQAEPPVPFDPYSYHQGDKNVPVVNPPYKPELPLPLPPLPTQPRPEETIPPATVPKPRTEQPRPSDNNPCQPCRPCRPGNGWYPGKIAGRVIGRVFGGGRRCR